MHNSAKHMKYVSTLLITAAIAAAATFYVVNRRFSPKLAEARQNVTMLSDELNAARDTLRVFRSGTTHEWLGGPICLYYWNPIRGKKIDRYYPCGDDSVFPVERRLSATLTPVEDAIRMLIGGELTDEEKEAGFQTEFPLPEATFVSATLENGVLFVLFNDPKYRTSGGNCRVESLRAQIGKTALQFPWVRAVEFDPNQFQP